MYLKTHTGFFVSALLAASAASAAPPQTYSPRDYAQLLYMRLAGATLIPGSDESNQVEALIQQGKLIDAAKRATDQDTFYGIVLKNWASSLLTVDETPYAPLNDAQAMIIGVARDDLDARTLLTGDFTYAIDPRFSFGPPAMDSNLPYERFDQGGYNYKKFLVRSEPQWPQLLKTPQEGQAAGILTSRGWAEIYYKAGTNRRALLGTFNSFLCTPPTGWMERGLPQFRIRRDVTRTPGGDAGEFMKKCAACHAPMDAMAGAFAYLDYQNDTLTFSAPNVAAKYNQNEKTYPEGYVTDDDSWLNYASSVSRGKFGWRGEVVGKGIHEFGVMISNSEGFSQCMAKRAFKQVCRKEPGSAEQPALATLAQDFETSGYKIKSLFEEVATNPSCLGKVNP